MYSKCYSILTSVYISPDFLKYQQAATTFHATHRLLPRLRRLKITSVLLLRMYLSNVSCCESLANSLLCTSNIRTYYRMRGELKGTPHHIITISHYIIMTFSFHYTTLHHEGEIPQNVYAILWNCCNVGNLGTWKNVMYREVSSLQE